MSRYEFARLLARELGVDERLVKPTSISNVKLVARRPRDSSLDTSRALSLGIQMPPIQECVRDFIKTCGR